MPAPHEQDNTDIRVPTRSQSSAEGSFLEPAVVAAMIQLLSAVSLSVSHLHSPNQCSCHLPNKLLAFTLSLESVSGGNQTKQVLSSKKGFHWEAPGRAKN